MTCSCRYERSAPAATRTRTTSPLTDRKREVARRPDTAAIPTAWEYAPAPESREVVRLEDRYGLYIGGQFVEPLSNERYTTIDPAREEPLAEVAQAGKADVDRAVKAARGAYADSWSRIRPSERAKYLFRQAELPPGVVNIITGDGRTGAELVSHPDVNKIAFTGSTEVGKAIQKTLAGTGKRLTLELGGKAANIIFDDAPLDQAVEGIINGIYFNQGHVCCAGSRLLVEESIYETVVSKLKRRMQTLRIGDPLDKNTDVGAINSKQQLEKIGLLVQSGIDEGAEVYQPPCKLPERGYWFAPTVFTNVAQSYRIAQEEIFGPVLSVLTFRTPDEAIEKANNTPSRLSAGVRNDRIQPRAGPLSHR